MQYGFLLVYVLNKFNDIYEKEIDWWIDWLGGADRTTNEINKLLGTLPPAVQALTGVDLTGVII